jgi:predicted esterase
VSLRSKAVAVGLIVMSLPACAGGDAASTTGQTEPSSTSAPSLPTIAPTTATTRPAVTSSAPDEVTTTVKTGCELTPKGELLTARRTAASPYYVHHPTASTPDTPTVMFIPGGTSGTPRAAQRIWENYLSNGDDVDNYRVIVPYAEEFDLYDDEDRLVAIVDEVLGCFGGDPAKIHLAGHSRGGQIAFDLMLRHPEVFTSLLGAPGEFRSIDPETWRERLAGKAVFNGVGELDGEWKPPVRATHEGLIEAGIDSVYVEFPNEGHGLGADFDENIFFEFWASH